MTNMQQEVAALQKEIDAQEAANNGTEAPVPEVAATPVTYEVMATPEAVTTRPKVEVAPTKASARVKLTVVIALLLVLPLVALLVARLGSTTMSMTTIEPALEVRAQPPSSSVLKAGPFLGVKLPTAVAKLLHGIKLKKP